MLKKEYESMIYNNVCSFDNGHQFVDPALFRSFVQVSASRPDFAEEGVNKAFATQFELLERRLYDLSMQKDLPLKNRQEEIRKAYDPLTQSLREVFTHGDDQPFIPLHDTVWDKILNDPNTQYLSQHVGVDFVTSHHNSVDHYPSSHSGKKIELSKDSFSHAISHSVSPNNGIDVSKQIDTEPVVSPPQGQDIIQAWRKRMEVLDKKRNKKPLNKRTQETLDSMRKIHNAESFTQILNNAQVKSVENSAQKWVSESSSHVCSKDDNQLSK